eukprot:1155686-Prymnesium_polylepis.1
MAMLLLPLLPLTFSIGRPALGLARARQPQCSISQVLTIGLKEGKTVDDLKALWAENTVIANEMPGVLGYSCAADEESAAAKKITIQETFTSLKAHMEFATKLGEAELMGKILETLTTTIYGEPLTDEYKEFLEPFGSMLVSPQTWIVHDFPRKGN